MKENIMTTKGDSVGKVDDLIDWLKQASDLGATDYEMVWSEDPQWPFKWFNAYKVLTEEEIRNNKIEKLERELHELKRVKQ